MGKIGFINNEGNNEKKIKDKLHQKPEIKVIWEIAPREESIEENKNSNTEEMRKNNEEYISRDDKTLSNYFNLAIFFTLVNYKNVTISNAMKFATDKNFCDKYYERQNGFLHSDERKRLRQAEDLERANELADKSSRIFTQLKVREEKIMESKNKTSIVFNILNETPIYSCNNIFLKDIRYMNKKVSELKTIDKELTELTQDRSNRGIMPIKKWKEKHLKAIIQKWEDWLKTIAY